MSDEWLVVFHPGGNNTAVPSYDPNFDRATFAAEWEAYLARFATWPFECTHATLLRSWFAPGGPFADARQVFEDGARHEGLDPDSLDRLRLDFTCVSGVIDSEGHPPRVVRLSHPTRWIREIGEALGSEDHYRVGALLNAAAGTHFEEDGR